VSNSKRPESELDRALDGVLARTFSAPRVPEQFRARLAAALVRAADSSNPDARARLEREHRARLEELEQNYVRLRRRTLGTMIGGAFAAGAAAAVALPWVTARLGDYAPLAIASTGAAAGLALGFWSWLTARSRASAFRAR
jgi:hypothetical protein